MKHNTTYQIRSDYASVCVDTDNELIIELDSACNRPTMNFATLHDDQLIVYVNANTGII